MEHIPFKAKSKASMIRFSPKRMTTSRSVQEYTITGFSWAGVYAEPIPANPSDTDFVVEIWGVDPANNNHADTAVVPSSLSTLKVDRTLAWVVQI